MASAYQGGGLTAAIAPTSATGALDVLGADEEDEDQTFLPAPTSKSVVTDTLKRIRMNRDKALASLEAGRQALMQQRYDPSTKWLRLAQGLLAPTRTGGFGETLGRTAGALAEEKTAAREYELDRSRRLLELEAQMRGVESSAISQELAAERLGKAGARKMTVGGIEQVVHPEDIDKPVERQRLVLAVARVRPDGTVKPEVLTDDNGEPFLAISKDDPRRRGAIEEAIERSEATERREQGSIEDAITAYQARIDTARGLGILSQENIKTSGFNAVKTSFAEWLGVELPDTVDLAELQTILGDDYIARMEAFTGPKSDRDVAEAKAIAAGIGRNTTVNWRRLQRLQTILERTFKAGLKAAYDRGDNDALLRMGVDPSLPIIKSQKAYDDLPAGAQYYEEMGGTVFEKPEETETPEA